ncbi:uncharacterized protein SPAPADRAFT_52507 [Spathaspora passalidarum NRRL Y-27907]|uniref:Central kinetochore subunit MCM21 n=1 Tax=Spathaspora passalidarum (strain NRRL Y-27907 / 11-Y1) TaxID=619300 RepID=G3AU45_SPAPN|nr:uncharacterized protein SPAPADRAFT_52507 [Spathaspora passalidarum NRRL Y-27907]EGW30421.1 hypothetical protein SPAPADRAFT_52507 [Spathaspora passalidarum NRRL Y-27907]
MEAGVITKEVEDLRHDITSLSADVSSLQKTHNEILQEIKQLEEEEERETNKNTNQTVIEDSTTDIPEIMKHSHFDPSISVYFKETAEKETEKEDNDDDDDDEKDTEFIAEPTHTKSIQEELELKENILYENIFRMVGITAFPINQYVFNADDELMGIRFDRYASSTNTFQPPHYVILRQINIYSEKEQELTIERKTWSVYKHTLPNYVPLSDYQKLLDESKESIIQFTRHVRDFLTKIQYKHDKLDQLLQLRRKQFDLPNDSPIISNIERDLSCERIQITFKSKNKLFLELLLSTDTIEVCTFKSSISSSHKQQLRFCESILRDCNISDIIKKTRSVIQTLVSHNLIE